jgi:hypothetical protein
MRARSPAPVGGTRIMPKGKFSQPAFGGFEAMAYVAGDGVTEFITRSVPDGVRSVT